MLTPERLKEIDTLWSQHPRNEWSLSASELIAEIHRLQGCGMLAACEAALPELEEWERVCVDESRCEPVDSDLGLRKLRNTITARKVAIAKWKGEKGYWTSVE